MHNESVIDITDYVIIDSQTHFVIYTRGVASTDLVMLEYGVIDITCAIPYICPLAMSMLDWRRTKGRQLLYVASIVLWLIFLAMDRDTEDWQASTVFSFFPKEPEFIWELYNNFVKYHQCTVQLSEVLWWIKILNFQIISYIKMNLTVDRNSFLVLITIQRASVTFTACMNWSVSLPHMIMQIYLR